MRATHCRKMKTTESTSEGSRESQRRRVVHSHQDRSTSTRATTCESIVNDIISNPVNIISFSPFDMFCEGSSSFLHIIIVSYEKPEQYKVIGNTSFNIFTQLFQLLEDEFPTPSVLTGAARASRSDSVCSLASTISEVLENESKNCARRNLVR